MIGPVLLWTAAPLATSAQAATPCSLTDLGRFEEMDFLLSASATAINASGFVVGWCKFYLAASHAMSWADARTPVDLGELPGASDR